MSLQIENALPDGFVLEKAQNVMHGTYRGIDLLIVPLDTENQYQIQLYANLGTIDNKEGFLDYLGTMSKDCPFVHHAGYNGSNMVSVYVLSRGVEDKENLTNAMSQSVQNMDYIIAVRTVKTRLCFMRRLWTKRRLCSVIIVFHR